MYCGYIPHSDVSVCGNELTGQRAEIVLCKEKPNRCSLNWLDLE